MRFNAVIRAVSLSLAIAAVALTSSACSIFGGSDSSSEPDSVPKASGASAAHLIRVTVKFGNDEKSVAMSGGTVDEAVKRAGYDSGKYNVDADLNAKVTDGMVITLTEKSQDGVVTENGRTSYDKNGGQKINTMTAREEAAQY